MISLTELKAKAERQYVKVLRASVSGEELFPLSLATNKKLDKARGGEHIFAQQQELITHSKHRTGVSYGLELKENSRTKQSEIKRIYFKTRKDLLIFIGKEIEFQNFQNDIRYILGELPILKEFLIQSPKTIIKARGKWKNLIAVCHYFIENPLPNLHARSLPIAIPTKFVENNQRTLRILLDYLIPEALDVDETDFFKRYHLHSGEPLVRIRFLDETLSPHTSLSQIGVLVSELSAYQPVCDKVFIIENLASFLSFPKLPGSIAIWGEGFAVNLLKDVGWLAGKAVYYWGDIDVHGFQILSQIRGIFPNVKSLMMDEPTLRNFYKNQKGGNFIKTKLPNLTEAESELYEQIEANNYRLEQEKIPKEHVNDKCQDLA